ncbi:MAG: ATP-dependent zinc metalloprotease FtsH [bacterium]|nr:ATP-dependent zinc metalloprotease FtsH [bacterium]
MDDRMNQYNNGGGYNNGNRPGGNRDGNGNNGNEPPRRPSPMLIFLGILSLVTCILAVYYLANASSLDQESEEVPYSQFLQYVEQDAVEQVTVRANKEAKDILVEFSLKSDKSQEEENQRPAFFLGIGFYNPQQTEKLYYSVIMEDVTTLTARLEEHGIEAERSIQTSSFLEIIVTYLLPVLIMVILFSVMFRMMGGSGGPMGVGKNNAKVYVQKETGVTFKDVAGEDEAKESLVEVVDFLHNPGKYSKIGARLPKGALLVGPPGTGKTLLAKAVAGEAHVPFFSLTGSDFIELYVGVGASRVRDLFKEATKNAPCIIFIDEIDAIGRSRDSKYGGGGNEEREQTLNQLLSEMDGFDSSKGILILGATNRPEILDKALLRPGRFDRRIIVDKPDLRGRVEILKVHSKDVKMDETVDLDAIALATSGAVGSDLANMINEAAINAVKEGREYVCQKDLFDAVEVVLVGKEKKDRIMSKEERRIVSYHEVGHALISALQKNSEPVQKITIVPRTMGALGYVMHVPEEEKYLNTEAELRDMLVGLMGGRAAEEVVFDTVTTGAANDIEKATDIARNMVTRYGMSKKFGLVGLATVESQYLEGRMSLNCSDETAAKIDAEIVEILKESYDKAISLLRENREIMDKLAEFLIEKETITGKEFMEIFRREKGIPEPEEKEAEKDGQKENKADVIEMPGPVAEPEEKESAEPLKIPGENKAADGKEPEASNLSETSPESGEADGGETGAEAAESAERHDVEPQADSAEEATLPEKQEPTPSEREPQPGRPPEDNSPRGRFSNGRIN